MDPAAEDSSKEPLAEKEHKSEKTKDDRHNRGERDDKRRDKDGRDRRDRDGRRRSRSREYRRRSRSRSGGRGSRRDRDRRDYERDHRDRDRDYRDRDRDRDRDRRERRRSRSRSPIIEKTEEELEAEKQAEEIEDLTKDQRTVFVSQLVMKADERIVKKFFEKVGKVKQVIMIRDKYTNRHKGFAYVEMAQLDAIPLVLMIHNTVPDFQKFPILIKASEAEKNFLAKQESAAAASSSAAMVKDRLYVGNLHELIGEDDLREVLKNFGSIDSVKVTRDETGKSKGYGFVKFARAEEAENALTKLDQQGLELMGKVLKVGFVNDAPNGNTPGNWKLDDDEGKTGVTLDSNSRLALMQRLGGGTMDGAPMPGLPIMPPVLPPMPIPPLPVPLPTPTLPLVAGLPSCAIKINNMFDPATETEVGWELDIKEDTEQECSKFGTVTFSHVDNVSPGGIVYVVFNNQNSAAQATTHLHGRWFAGRTITIEYMQPEAFVAQFPAARDAISAAL